MRRPLFILSWLIHHRKYAYIPAEEINAEAGTMDDYCTCWLCRRVNKEG